MCHNIIFPIFLLLYFLLGAQAPAADIPPEHQSKIKAVVALWEYEHDEFIRLTRLSETQKHAMADLATKEKDEKILRGLTLLLVLNCKPVDQVRSPFVFLESYRCTNGSFEVFLSRALVSFENIYALAFVKEQDRLRAMSFLERYIKFWKDEAVKKGGASLSESDAEYLREILRFLEKGGYH
jgi:hypothetical protein